VLITCALLLRKERRNYVDEHRYKMRSVVVLAIIGKACLKKCSCHGCYGCCSSYATALTHEEASDIYFVTYFSNDLMFSLVHY